MAHHQQGLLRPVIFWRELVDLMRARHAVVEASGEGPLPLWNPHFQFGDVYTMVLSAAVLGALKMAFLSLADYPILKHMKYVKKRKFFENVFYTLFYSMSFSFGLYTIHKEQLPMKPFSNDSLVLPLFEPFPPPMSPTFRAYYATQMGFYIGLLTYLLVDTRRSDFAQYCMHHLVTLGLMSASAAFSFVRVGLVILVLHDLSDIFLYGAKTVHYLGLRGVDTALFAVFALSFLVARLIIYPRVVYSVMIEAVVHCHDHPEFNGWVGQFTTILPLWGACVVLLVILLVLNAFWMSLISLMIYGELSGTSTVSEKGDVRSGEDDADDDD